MSEFEEVEYPVIELTCETEECENSCIPVPVPDNGFLTICGPCGAVLKPAVRAAGRPGK